MFTPLIDDGGAGAYAPWRFEGLSDQEETSVCTMLMTELNQFEVLSFLVSIVVSTLQSWGACALINATVVPGLL